MIKYFEIRPHAASFASSNNDGIKIHKRVEKRVFKMKHQLNNESYFVYSFWRLDLFQLWVSMFPESAKD